MKSGSYGLHTSDILNSHHAMFTGVQKATKIIDAYIHIYLWHMHIFTYTPTYKNVQWHKYSNYTFHCLHAFEVSICR